MLKQILFFDLGLIQISLLQLASHLSLVFYSPKGSESTVAHSSFHLTGIVYQEMTIVIITLLLKTLTITVIMKPIKPILILQDTIPRTKGNHQPP